jgi:hypothetical protein
MLNYITHKEAIMRLSRGEMQHYASEHNLNYNSVRARKSEWKNEMLLNYEIPEPVKSFDEAPLYIPSASFLVLADIHAPYHNKRMIERALKICKLHFSNVRDAVFAGDLYNFEAISSHPIDGPSTGTNTDMHTAGAILRRVMADFDAVTVIPGNHCRRIMKAMKSEYDFAFVVNGSLGSERPHNCELRTSNLSYCYAGKNGNRDWLIYHPTSYSGFGGKTPAEQAQLDQINVVGSHNHVMGMMQSKDGKYIGVDPGHLSDESYHWYHAKDRNKFAAWTAGFCIVSNGRPYLFNDLITDWQALGVR